MGDAYTRRLIAAPALIAVALGGCDDWRHATTQTWQLEPVSCVAPRTSEPIPLGHFSASATISVSFGELQQRVDARCQECHVGVVTGGFSYVDSYAGFTSAAAAMVKPMLAGTMPPGDADPDGTHLLAATLQAWIAAGTPNGSFTAPASAGPATGPGAFAPLSPAQASAMSNLGTCIPDASSVARLAAADEAKDRFFATATTLPPDLSATDVDTFDSAALARHRVFAYAPAYPLWSDDARKLRLVRVPRGQHIHYDKASGHFVIPPNTRFYKTFFKSVIGSDGKLAYRAIETRLIVSRPSVDGVDQALFGTYLWNDDGSQATLWDGPYRDGTPFRDRVFAYTDNELAKHQRTYAIPARHRCIQCHEGSEGQNFILGFTPLQVNQRGDGQGGELIAPEADELSQVERLLAYGVIDGLESASNLPLLESSGGDRQPRNDYELRAQAYMTANCAHCHNRRGFPVRDEPRLSDFDLSPGGIVFQFPVGATAVSAPAVPYVSPLGLDLSNYYASLIYRRVATPVTTVWTDPTPQSDPTKVKHLAVPHMPANTPGMDCRAPNIIGAWIASIPVTPGGAALPDDASAADVMAAQKAAAQRAATFDGACAPPADVADWVVEDLTEPKVYTPRRADFDTWRTSEDGIDPLIHPELIHGMPKTFRDLAVDESFAALTATPVPAGYWNWQSQCHFPADLPPNPGDAGDHAFYRRPWMLTPSGQTRRPLGEVFFDTPGAAIFRAVCSNCHGARADGNSGNAKALLQLSDGTIRVANLMQGLFKNLPLFDQPGPMGQVIAPYGSAKYLVWMASGGTTVQFPDGFEALLGSDDKKFGGNMLTKVSYYCARLLPSAFWIGTLSNSDPYFNGIPAEQRELWTAFCGYRNQPIPDANHVPPDFDAEKWIRTAKYNGGLMMYFFFRDKASRGDFPPGPDHCEQRYGGGQP